MSTGDGIETQPNNTDQSKVLPKECKTKINQRRGHRSYVTHTANTANQYLRAFSEDKRNQLNGFKVVLNDKLNVLEKLDNEILEYLSDEGEIEVEIGRASDVRSEIQQLIVSIDSKLKSSDVPSRVADPVNPKRFANLPKLTINSFGGNPIDFQTFWDNFRVAVHENNSLEKIMKFNYLKMSRFLKGS